MTTNSHNVRALLGRKVGMTQVWGPDNVLVPVTVVEVAGNVVTDVRTPEKDGYAAVQLGYGRIDPRKVNQPMSGHFERAGVPPRRHLTEVRTSVGHELGAELGPDTFSAGDVVDVVGRTKGKGHSGVMKRHGFSGVGASHGAHRNHRKPGSIGACATPGRVFKGLRMAGRLGSTRQTAQNLRVQAVDAERSLLLLRGALPGPRGGVVLVKTASKSVTTAKGA